MMQRHASLVEDMLLY